MPIYSLLPAHAYEELLDLAASLHWDLFAAMEPWADAFYWLV